ncbi:hypothetical protein, partial [Fischerella thermalis]|uniref:hypothetical protein n=1 Tax=Fischerella thermalis TaxID=372787 RepID=UPI0015E0CE39
GRRQRAEGIKYWALEITNYQPLTTNVQRRCSSRLYNHQPPTNVQTRCLKRLYNHQPPTINN